MGHSIGDGLIVAAVVVGVIGYLYLKSQERRRRLELVHAERLAAMDKGIPLPELSLDPAPTPPRPLDRQVTLVIGIVLAMFALGGMAALALIRPERTMWPVPLPMAFLGLGLVLFYLLTREGPRSSSSTHRDH